LGLGKDKGSSRINRYEHQVTAIGFDNLHQLAEVLDVPVAYLLADDAAIADAILALSEADKSQRDVLAPLIPPLIPAPTLLPRLLKLVPLPTDRKRVRAG